MPLLRWAVPILVVVVGVPGGVGHPDPGPAPATVRPLGGVKDRGSFANLPLTFEANRGQTDPSVRYLARGEGHTVYLTDRGPVFSLPAPALQPGVVGPALPDAAVGMDLVGSTAVAPTAMDLLPGVVNYLRGPDRRAWHTGVPTYGRVAYRDVYPGIDLLFSGTGRALEYDFVVAPAADPRDIALRFAGAESLNLGSRGELVVGTAAGRIVHRPPVIYQEVDGHRRPVSGAYRVERGRVRFAVGSFDHTIPLVIDPVVVTYSTFLGGAEGDEGFGIAVDGSGAMFVTGETRDHSTTDFPTTLGAYDTEHNGIDDVFVAKLNPAGTALVYSTFLGGSGGDEGEAIAVDGSGAAYVTGVTADSTTDFPFTTGAFDTSHNGGVNDAFVAKLTPAGDGLAYSTFLGGSGGDRGFDIAVDGSGTAYVTGAAEAGYPTTPGGFDTTADGPDVFVTKLIPDEVGTTDLAYSTFLGGTAVDQGRGIAVDGSGTAYVTGFAGDAAMPADEFPTTPGAFDTSHNGGVNDAFVTKLIPDEVGTTDLAYSTFLGGTGDDNGLAIAIAIDGSGAAHVTGNTADDATDFPTTAGAFDTVHNGSSDIFVTKVDPSGGALGYSTFIGGSGLEQGMGIALDALGAAHVAGFTNDASFPTTPGAFDESFNGGGDDAVAIKLGPSGAGPLLYSTFLGGSSTDFGEDVAVDGAGTAYVAGRTSDDVTDFPTTAGAFDADHNGDTDAFVAKLVETAAPTPPVPPAPGPAPAPSPAGSCKGKTATMTGTAGDDTLTGTSGADVVAALGGNDQVATLGGNDLVCAGDGNDTANGGGGKDQILGENGNDKLKGGGANDKLKGGQGTDTCSGGSGDKDKAGCEKEKTVP